MKNKVYTTREVGKFCGVDLTSVINWVKNGKLKAYKTAGGHRRINNKDLITFMKKYSMPVPLELMSKGVLSLLVICKEQQVLNIINDTLNKLYLEYKVTEADGNFDIGYKLAVSKPDIIIIDIDIKSISGHKVIKKICDTGGNEKIIAIRNINNCIIPEMLEEAGADVVLTKPLEIEEFERAVVGTER